MTLCRTSVSVGAGCLGRADGGGFWYPRASMADPKWADVESVVAIPFCLLSTELHICISLDCRISNESKSDTRRKDIAV